jgi:hypothetical protein
VIGVAKAVEGSNVDHEAKVATSGCASSVKAVTGRRRAGAEFRQTAVAPEPKAFEPAANSLAEG